MKKKKSSIDIEFVGTSSEVVTGSMTLVKVGKTKILIEAGLYQSNDVWKNYKVNSRNFKFKPSEIDYVFVCHTHIDHIGLLGKLYKDGCKAKIICVKDSTAIIKALLRDGCHIMGKDAELISKQKGRLYKPICEDKDIDVVIGHLEEHEFNKVYKLNEDVSFKFIPSGHIIRGSQLVLYLKQGGTTKKVLYTSDLGNVKLDKPFVEKFQEEDNAHIVIAESTYGNGARTVSVKDRDKDLEKIKATIDEVVDRGSGRILIPAFALDRTQTMLKFIYDMYGKDENFKLPVLVDSPLAKEMTKIYSDILEGEDKEQIDEILSWSNLRLVDDWKESQSWVCDNKPCIIISASGMLVAGRSINWVKSLIENPNNIIMFCGYAGEDTLAGQIKNGNGKTKLKIDNRWYKNKCKLIVLRSFSSHIQQDSMLDYYSSINCERIFLHHGDMSAKLELATKLEEEYNKKFKTTKVFVTTKDLKVKV